MVPFTGYLMMEARKGNMSGVKQGVGRYLQGLKGSAKILTPLGKSLKNEVILADAAFRATILDNAKEAKKLHEEKAQKIKKSVKALRDFGSSIKFFKDS